MEKNALGGFASVNEMKYLKADKKESIKIIIYILIGMLSVLNVFLCFNDRVWLDETFSMKLMMQPFGEILYSTAADVHPPLYYFLLRFVYMADLPLFFLRFLSLCPVIILMLVFVRVVLGNKLELDKIFSKWQLIYLCVFVLILLGLGQRNVEKNIELRMYTWALLFVSLTLLEAVRIFWNSNSQYRIYFRMSIWGLYLVLESLYLSALVEEQNI